MYSITYHDGVKKTYVYYNEFADAVDVIRKAGTGFVSYYDRHGDTHLCTFRLIRGGVQCLNLFVDLMGADVYDCTGKHYSSKVFEAVADMVKYERMFEFCGWSI